jgi:hypothetical protein
MQSKAPTISAYLSQLPDERKQGFSELVNVIRRNIPVGFSEGMGYGMPGWVVPHSIYPKGYHCDTTLPLPFLSIASQKNHIALYHMGLQEGKLLDWFREQWNANSKRKLDMGKGCVRFKKPEDIPFKLIGELVAKLTPTDWITIYENALNRK